MLSPWQKKMTIQDVADLLGLGWDTIKSIFKRYLFRRFSRPKLGKLKYIAIDEISVRKGQKYLTLVMDLESGAGETPKDSDMPW